MDLGNEFVLPLNKGNILPKNSLDRGLFVLMTVLIPFITVWEIYILYKSHNSFDLYCTAHLFFILYLVINIIGNLYHLQRVDSSGKQKNLPAVPPANWRYCHFCQINCPPRSYHCPICEECILKRDQHCMVAGCCVGFYNHRYYIMAVAYIMIGSLYAWMLQWPYWLESIGGFHLLPMISMAAPHIAVLFGFLSFSGFLFAVSQVLLTLVIILTCYLLIVQVHCIFYGQTIHERKGNILLYDLGWKKNFIQVLGKKWYLAFFSPFALSPIEGDGVSFQTFYDLQEVKNV